jgi:uncharacterized paraquat-inducible protein A
MSTHTALCPYCEYEVELPVEEFDTVANCPHCGEPVSVQANATFNDGGEAINYTYEFAKIQDFAG